MGALTRGYDWSKTSLGPPELWPQSLRVTVRLVLTSRHPMFIWWGTGAYPVLQRCLSRDDGPRKASKRSGSTGSRVLGRDMGHHCPQIEYVVAGKGRPGMRINWYGNASQSSRGCLVDV
jgi:hypothetical protein